MARATTFLQYRHKLSGSFIRQNYAEVCQRIFSSECEQKNKFNTYRSMIIFYKPQPLKGGNYSKYDHSVNLVRNQLPTSQVHQKHLKTSRCACNTALNMGNSCEFLVVTELFR